jgi:PPOX class probable F420-dependent enzyme
MPVELPEEVLVFLRRARVGHLATVDEAGQPSVVPVCFAIDPPRLYTAIDAKPKRVAPERLRRVRNLAANPEAALVVDRWDEEWSRLGWVLLRGRAERIAPGAEQARALALLREKYAQYRAVPLEAALVLRLAIARYRVWGDLSRPQFPG